jgi:hypothetical protein
MVEITITKWQNARKSSITHRTQVTASERGWQTIMSWLARGDLVDGWKKSLDHFEEIGGVVDTSPSLRIIMSRLKAL